MCSFSRSLLTLTLLMSFALTGAAQNWKREVRKFQKDLNHHYRDAETSPLTEEDRASFKSLDYFPANSTLCFQAHINRTPEAQPFEMATVSGKNKTFRSYAVLEFSHEGTDYQLTAYRRIQADGSEGDYLFIPFKDESTGEESYGGGRYIDLDVPSESATQLTLDFNHAYNPYCAYSTGWSCPIPPQDNYLPFKVLAGVRAWEKGHH